MKRVRMVRPCYVLPGSMRSSRVAIVAALYGGLLGGAAWCPTASAQDVVNPRVSQRTDEIIVTARKRQESILEVPVVVAAVSGQQLNNFQVTQVSDLPSLVPGLVLSGNLLAVGPQITIRGVGTSSADPGVDQSVSLNVDGLSLGQGLAFASGMFDVQQVEVLKGPQALFYGKSSPGGVISLRTADPTDEAEVITRAGYEFEAREARGELIVSGPASDTLGLRLATTYSAGQGYYRNVGVAAAGLGGVTSRYDRETRPRNFIVRGTALWKPTPEFSARLKLNHAYDRNINNASNQLAGCPDGPGQTFSVPGLGAIPFIGGDDCKLDRKIRTVHLEPAAFPGIINNGVPFLQMKQDFATLEMNYDILPDLSLSSTTAYYKLNSSSMVNTTATTSAGPTLAVTNYFRRRQFTEEIRLNSDFSGPINFTAGAFFEDGQLYDRVLFLQNRRYTFIPAGAIDMDRDTTVDIRTYSLFGQLRYELSDQLEVAGGVRWTDETRSEQVFDFRADRDITATLPRPKINASNFSPEATLTYTPTDDVTLFASYKKAYKSGSFKVSVPPVPGENNAFDDERVEGYEIGLKTRALDRSLLANIAFYDYRYKGLQVGAIEPNAAGGSPVIRTVNAGAARTYGIDVDVSYRPPGIEGLSLSAAVNWNRARYKRLDNIPCYGGQTIEQGCTLTPDPRTGRFTAQDLSGTTMIRAPRWVSNLAATYETPVSDNLVVVIGTNNQISSKFPTFQAIGRPGNDNFQKGFIKTDLTLTLKDSRERWEFSVIGKNIADKITASNCSATNYAGGNFLGGQITGGVTSGPAGFSERSCYTDRGRSIWARITLRH